MTGPSHIREVLLARNVSKGTTVYIASNERETTFFGGTTEAPTQLGLDFHVVTWRDFPELAEYARRVPHQLFAVEQMVQNLASLTIETFGAGGLNLLDSIDGTDTPLKPGQSEFPPGRDPNKLYVDRNADTAQKKRKHYGTFCERHPTMPDAFAGSRGCSYLGCWEVRNRFRMVLDLPQVKPWRQLLVSPLLAAVLLSLVGMRLRLWPEKERIPNHAEAGKGSRSRGGGGMQAPTEETAEFEMAGSAGRARRTT
jgi:hypothetical protein